MTLILSSAIVDGYGLETKHGEEVKRDMIGNLLRMVMVWNVFVCLFDYIGYSDIELSICRKEVRALNEKEWKR